MKTIITLLVLAVVGGYVANMPAEAEKEACVDRIVADNNAHGMRTDYRGAYETCRVR